MQLCQFVDEYVNNYGSLNVNEDFDGSIWGNCERGLRLLFK